MPVPDEDIDSWARQVEAESLLPPREEHIKGNTKIVTDYKLGENDEKIKIISEYKIERKMVPKSIANRKKWRKYGQAASDPAGPNPANMFISNEEIKLQFIRNRAGEYIDTKMDDDPLTKLKSTTMMRCQHCKGIDHFSMRCPYKHMIEEQRQFVEGGPANVAANDRQREIEEKVKAGTYVSPALRAGGSRPGVDLNKRQEDFTVRVTNLPEDTTDDDLKDLFKQAGRVQRIFLAKDKTTNKSKGFAFITYMERKDAEKAIQVISGHRYDHLILKVEWARPT